MKSRKAPERSLLAALMFVLASAICLVASHQAYGQAAAPAATQPAATAAAPEEETVALPKFVVSSEEDKGSYRATSTLAGTRVRTDLRDVASSISVVTEQFLIDTAATNNQDLLVYTANTEVGGLGGNFSGNANGGSTYEEFESLRSPHTNTRVRGLDSADNTRDFFLTDIPWDSFNVGRIDIQRGPNSILFGVGSPAGIINSSVNTAGYTNSRKAENRFDGYGSLRESADINQVILPNVLSVRVAGLLDQKRFKQKPAFNNTTRYFGALRFEPKLLGEGNRTSIRANYEYGTVNSNNPRMLPPVDAISPWFLTGTGPTGLANLNKKTFEARQNNNSGPNFKNHPWVGGRVGRQDWADTAAFYTDPNSGTPSFAIEAQPNPGFQINSSGKPGGSIAYPTGDATKLFVIQSYSAYGQKTSPPNLLPEQGGANSVDRSVSDSSIFDFYNHLIDGPNKREWQNWKASNAAVSQTLLNDRLGFEVAYDYQSYTSGGNKFLGAQGTYKLSVDINSELQNQTPNPNVGRPYVANSTEGEFGTRQEQTIVRKGIRFTTTAELRAEDFLGKDNNLSRWLGKHVITGLYSDDSKNVFRKSWTGSAAEVGGYAGLISPSATGEQLDSHLRAYDWVVYLGPSLINASSPAGANISRINTRIDTPRSVQTRYFDTHWNKATTPGDPNYVDPAAPFDYTIEATTGHYLYGVFDPSQGQAFHATQSQNPANYKGWTTTTVNFLSDERGDINALMMDAAKQRIALKSKAFVWQGHLLDDAFVPTLGWRRDEVSLLTGQGAKDALNVVSTEFQLNPKTRSISKGESKSWGGVLRMPRRMSENMPLGTNVSVFYNRSENFKADAPRGDIAGNQLDNPIGKTKEYGFGVSTLHDKLSLKVTWYETSVANATLPGTSAGGFGGSLFWLDDAIPVWGTVFASGAYQFVTPSAPFYANESLGYGGTFNANYATKGKKLSTRPDGSAATGIGGFYGPGDPVWESDPATIAERKSLEAWGKDSPLTQAFFDAYGFTADRFNWSEVQKGNISGYISNWDPSTKVDIQGPHTIVRFGTPPVATVDTESKGQEYELTAQPIKNWNITVNASKTAATFTAISPTVVKFMNDYNTWLSGPAGDIHAFWSNSPLRNQWNNQIYGKFIVLQQLLNHQAPEVVPWRYNVITGYTFTEGRLKGVNIGGAYRWEQARVLGFKFDTSLGGTNPSTGKPFGALDITKPWKGASEDHIDLWVGYGRKLTDRVDWRIQLNLRNVGESPHLVPITVQPDGSPGFSRIADGLAWQVTNTLSF